MGFAKPTYFTSWSFSRWADWDKCPLYAKYKHLDKLPEPKHPAMARGIEIAEKTEAYMKKQASRLPKELASLGDHYKALRKHPGLQVEASWNFDTAWKPVAWNDWNRCVLRMKIDMHAVNKDQTRIDIIDNKTGKFTTYGVEKYDMQVDLYIAGGGIIYPQAKEFTARLWFSDQGVIYPEGEARVVTAAESGKLRKVWDRRVKPMMNDRRFPPKPGRHCNYCAFSKNATVDDGKGGKVAAPGPCKF
jgi:hypothetical protein